MRREARRRLAFTGEDAGFTKRLGASSLISVVRRDDLDDILDSEKRLKAENKLLLNFTRGAATYLCSCGDGDVCVGCAAMFTLRQVAALKRSRKT